MGSVVLGVIAIALGVWGGIVWWWSVTEILRGILPVVLTLGGLIALAAGIRTSKEEGNELEE